MLDRISDWRAYLSSEMANDQTDTIQRHSRTGRPLGTTAFVRSLERVTGRPLLPKRAGRKPAESNQVYCPRNSGPGLVAAVTRRRERRVRALAAAEN